VSQTVAVVFGGAKANAPGKHPLIRDVGVVAAGVGAGLLLNKLLAGGVPKPPATTPPAAPTVPKPPTTVAAPDLTAGTKGPGVKTGRNSTIMTSPSGLGSISQSNVQTKTLLGL
jgi:hypothetical protein